MKFKPQTFDDLKISATFSVSDQYYSSMALGAMICAPHFIAAPAELKICLTNKNHFNLIDNFKRCNRHYHPNFHGQVNREKQLSLETLAHLSKDAGSLNSNDASIVATSNRAAVTKSKDAQITSNEGAVTSTASSSDYAHSHTRTSLAAEACISSDPYDFAWSAPIPDFTSVSKLMRCHKALSTPKQSEHYNCHKTSSAQDRGVNIMTPNLSPLEDHCANANNYLISCTSMYALKNMHQALCDESSATRVNQTASQRANDLAAQQDILNSPSASCELFANEYDASNLLCMAKEPVFLSHAKESATSAVYDAMDQQRSCHGKHAVADHMHLGVQNTHKLQDLRASCHAKGAYKHAPNLGSLFSPAPSPDNYDCAMISEHDKLHSNQAQGLGQSNSGKGSNTAPYGDKHQTLKRVKSEDELLFEQLNGSEELKVLNNYRLTFNYSLRSNYPQISAFAKDLAHYDEPSDRRSISTSSQAQVQTDATTLTKLSQQAAITHQVRQNIDRAIASTDNCTHRADQSLQGAPNSKTRRTNKGKPSSKLAAATESNAPIAFALESFDINKLKYGSAKKELV